MDSTRSTRPRRKTTAIADVRVNQEAGTPVNSPKGNITAGQDDRNPNLQTRDDQRPGPPSRAFSLDAARDAAAMPNAAPRPRPIAEAKRTGAPKRATPTRAAAKRTGSRQRN